MREQIQRARERETEKYGRQSENKTVFKDVPLGCLKTVAGLDDYKFENRRKRSENEGVKQRWWRVMENSLSSREREREGGRAG